ncbi:MAG: pyridoxamine 5'-phosphate oxidase family protein [Nocardiopsaceae bacterium]|nr:pyridoxamine 5'-phosphate oxidase family protein [Nocardiopsaceae bacterium]
MSDATHRRAQIRFTPEEVDTFLNDRHKVQVATVGRHGEPHLSTLFYAMVDGRLAFWTYAASQKAVNLRRDERMTCLVEDGDSYGELRGVVLYGRGEVLEDPETVLRVGTAATAAMTATPVADLQTPEAQAELARSGRKRVAVFMTVERVVSWDHSKLST